MDDQVKQIRDNCRKLADLIDQAEGSSGAERAIPPLAKALHQALGAEIGEKKPRTTVKMAIGNVMVDVETCD